MSRPTLLETARMAAAVLTLDSTGHVVCTCSYIAPRLARLLAHARAQALRDAADELERVASTQGVYFKGFVQEFLRDRADREAAS